MEIEAKFSLPDIESLRQFQTASRLVGFPLGKGRIVEIQDTYVDTQDRKILAGGYACRFRQEAGGVRVTLKGIEGASGAIHKRQEMEAFLPEMKPPVDWPASPLREQVLQLTGGDPCLPLFTLNQTRIVRPVRRQGKTIAELSLDDVRAVVGDTEQAYYELEVELTSQGSEEQLVRIAGRLQEKAKLRPEPLSKFERALSQLERGPRHALLDEREVEILKRIAERQDWHGQRSRALLELDGALPVEKVAKNLECSERTIRRWRVNFQRSRLSIFPADLLEAPPTPALQTQEQVSAQEPLRVDLPSASQPIADELPSRVGLQADDPMPEVLRKIMYFQFQHMLYHEAGVQSGQDIEELHDMRVATRRMRAALQVFKDSLDTESWEPFEKGLRRTGRILGEVRDLDVFWEKGQGYLDTLPPERKDELAPLETVWKAAHEQARARLLTYLESKRYRKFKAAFNVFLQIPTVDYTLDANKAEEIKPRRLRQLAPVILYQRLAEMNAFEEWMSGPNVPLARLHQLRIASKGLRYSLEFLEEVLGEEARDLIKEMKGLQDHLGNLQDAMVACNLLRDFLTWGTWGHEKVSAKNTISASLIVAPGVATYLAYRQAELQDLPAALPQIWARIQSPEFKHNFIAAISVL
ncbi:MAG TPA: CHAD domain-containing protein [Anaerolineales bacterium]|nr:CHAD domain-containing protein [Anaerolineales bacterium]